MSRHASPVDSARIVGIQRLHQTMAANELAEARIAESKALEQHRARERQAEESIDAWSAYLTSRSVDPDHLQRLMISITDDARQVAAAATHLSGKTEEADLRSRYLQMAGANLKQAEALNRKVARQALRKADEMSAQAVEERISFSWGNRR